MHMGFTVDLLKVAVYGILQQTRVSEARILGTSKMEVLFDGTGVMMVIVEQGQTSFWK